MLCFSFSRRSENRVTMGWTIALGTLQGSVGFAPEGSSPAAGGRITSPAPRHRPAFGASLHPTGCADRRTAGCRHDGKALRKPLEWPNDQTKFSAVLHRLNLNVFSFRQRSIKYRFRAVIAQGGVEQPSTSGDHLPGQVLVPDGWGVFSSDPYPMPGPCPRPMGMPARRLFFTLSAAEPK